MHEEYCQLTFLEFYDKINKLIKGTLYNGGKA